MTSPALEGLAELGHLKMEAPRRSEIGGLIDGGRARLLDTQRGDLSAASRFDLAYNAAHRHAFRRSLAAPATDASTLQHSAPLRVRVVLNNRVYSRLT